MKKKEPKSITYLHQQVAALRLALSINNQFLADVAGTLYDHDLHREEDEVLELIKMNRALLG